MSGNHLVLRQDALDLVEMLLAQPNLDEPTLDRVKLGLMVLTCRSAASVTPGDVTDYDGTPEPNPDEATRLVAMLHTFRHYVTNLHERDTMDEAAGRLYEEIGEMRAALAGAPGRAAPTEREPRCEGRYAIPGRDEPFEVTYRCGLRVGHGGLHAPAD